MRSVFKSALVIVLTVLVLLFLLSHDPFALAIAGLDRAFGAPPAWTQVDNLYRNPRTQDVSHAEDAGASMEVLAGYWRQHPDEPKVLFIGNSQMMTISLAPGEGPSSAPEKTYVDLVTEQLEEKHVLGYRLSAAGLSYPEAFWYLTFISQRPELRPSEIVLQMNYQAFWQGGIRSSMLPMLRDQGFRSRISALANSGQPYADTFQQALVAYSAQPQAGDAGQGNASAAAATVAKFSGSSSLGYRLESVVRDRFDGWGLGQHQAAEQESFTQMLYRSRLYLLHLKPSTARSIDGTRLQISRATVMGIAELCYRQSIPLVLFNAPVNPGVALYRTTADRDSYHGFVRSLAQKYELQLLDFEDAIPSQYWGHLLNGPDPLHMGRAGHRELAKQVLETLRFPVAAKAN
jgi:hypothetical protein